MSETRFYVGEQVTVRGNDHTIRTIIDLATRDNGTEYAVLHGPLCGECVTLDRLTHTDERDDRCRP